MKYIVFIYLIIIVISCIFIAGIKFYEHFEEILPKSEQQIIDVLTSLDKGQIVFPLNINSSINVVEDNPGVMLEKIYNKNSANRYGIGQWPNGNMRMYTANSSANNQATVNLSVANFDGSFNDVIKVHNNNTTDINGTLNMNDKINMKNGAWINYHNDGSGINWGNGYSQIFDNGHLHINTDDNMYINAPKVLEINTPSANVSGKFTTSQLCIGNTCITENKLNNLFDDASVGKSTSQTALSQAQNASQVADQALSQAQNAAQAAAQAQNAAQAASQTAQAAAQTAQTASQAASQPAPQAAAPQAAAPQAAAPQGTSKDSLNSAGKSILTAGQYLISNNGQYSFRFQGDANAVVYSFDSPTWSSGTSGTQGAYIKMQSDGNLVIYTANDSPVWACCLGLANAASTIKNGGGGNPPFTLTMQDDGNLVIYDSSNRATWDSTGW